MIADQLTSDLGTDRRDYLRVILFDGHGERTAGLATTITEWTQAEGQLPRLTASLHADCFWDPFGLDTVQGALTGLNTMDDMDRRTESNVIHFDQLFPGLYDRYAAISHCDRTWGTWWFLEGDREGHARRFEEIAEACSDPTSGDDDTYDYWPSAMDLLCCYARDLDAWRSTPDLESLTYRRRVIEVFEGVRRAYEAGEPASDDIEQPNYFTENVWDLPDDFLTNALHGD